MSIKTVFLLVLVGLTISCTSNQESKENINEKAKDKSTKKLIVETARSSKKELSSKEEKKESLNTVDCDYYLQMRFPADSVKEEKIDEIIKNNRDSLPINNLAFLKLLKKESTGLAFNDALNPVFRLKKAVGLVFYPKYKHIEDSIIPLRKETQLIGKHDTTTIPPYLSHNELRFFPKILDSIYSDQEKPYIYYYTTNRVDSTQIKALGEFEGECLEYLQYSIDTASINFQDSILIASPNKINLEFQNDERIDSLLKTFHNSACYDCPTSDQLQMTFAQIKGVENLYFVYADSFPINDKLHTPSRALIYVNENDEIIYLWYSEIDFFGCSCL